MAATTDCIFTKQVDGRWKGADGILRNAGEMGELLASRGYNRQHPPLHMGGPDSYLEIGEKNLYWYIRGGFG